MCYFSTRLLQMQHKAKVTDHARQRTAANMARCIVDLLVGGSYDGWADNSRSPTSTCEPSAIAIADAPTDLLRRLRQAQQRRGRSDIFRVFRGRTVDGYGGHGGLSAPDCISYPAVSTCRSAALDLDQALRYRSES